MLDAHGLGTCCHALKDLRIGIGHRSLTLDLKGAVHCSVGRGDGCRSRCRCRRSTGHGNTARESRQLSIRTLHIARKALKGFAACRTHAFQF